MKTKVVYNACFGGFSISKEACEMLAAAGVESAIEALKEHEDEPAKKWAKTFGFSYSASGMARHDPRLVSVVEALGDKANGRYAKLRIAEVDGPYRIDEYDGSESVETPDSYEWVTP